MHKKSNCYYRTRIRQPNVNFTHADITQQKASHEESLRLYLECQAVKQALRVQHVEAIDSIYLDALRNSDIDMIHKSLPKIMEHLMKNYGQVTLEDMHNKEQALISIHYDPNTPVDSVFSAVDKFWDLCILTDQPKMHQSQSRHQCMNRLLAAFISPHWIVTVLNW